MSATSSNSSDRDFEAIHRAQRAHEPSMEEILASIRNIIADEPARAAAQGAGTGADARAANRRLQKRGRAATATPPDVPLARTRTRRPSSGAGPQAVEAETAADAVEPS